MTTPITADVTRSATPSPDPSSPLRIAVVGLGPKALRAIGDLLARWDPSASLEVHCYDPNFPGQGAAFDPTQPNHLRLNVNPAHVTLNTMPPLDEWLVTQGIDPMGDVPRAEVGSYLAEGYQRLVDGCGDRVRITHHRCPVERLSRVGDCWRVEADTPAIVDEVLLSTGHARSHDDELDSQWDPDQPTRLVPHVYPVEQWLGPDQVPPGSTVVVRGAGLSFLDVVLTLTEARRREDWPRRILPTSPSGMLHHTRPAASWTLHPDDQDLVDRLGAAMPDDPRGVTETIIEAATGMMVMVGHDPTEAAEAVRHTLLTGWEPDLVHLPNRAMLALDRSISVAELAGRPGAAWVLGRAWGELHPIANRLLSFKEHDEDEWAEFLRIKHILDKFAYGPPLENAIRISDLCQRRVLDTSWLQSDVYVSDRVHNLPPGERQPDVVIDAVYSPPGARHARTPLVDQLLADGHVVLARGRRGLCVTDHAQCRDPQGNPVPGLAAFGLLTEDVVLGNDTLRDAPFEQSVRWAERVSQRGTGR